MSVNMVFMVFLYLLIWNNLDNMHIILWPFPFLSFQAKKSKQAANTANVKRQLQSLRNNLKLWDLEERHPTFENTGMFWKALVNYGEYVAILQLGAGFLPSNCKNWEASRWIYRRYTFPVTWAFFWGERKNFWSLRNYRFVEFDHSGKAFERVTWLVL